ncbi:MAG: nucleoside recognition protein [Lachnospiraceae bacterium]|nr:nucleoside recognition protein [Lachnospiraceae bacterium]
MMNMIWAGMILIGIIYAALTGTMDAVTNAAIDSAKDAVSLCITMLGVTSLWVGLMEIARSAGLIRVLTKVISPFIDMMFPRIPKAHRSREYIATNMVANLLGLGWAATPAGLEAMKALSDLEEERGRITRMENKIHIASDEMCTFLVINISSLQLIPVNIIAYRSQYGSVNPAAIIAPGLIATLISTLAGIVFCRQCMKLSHKNRT